MEAWYTGAPINIVPTNKKDNWYTGCVILLPLPDKFGKTVNSNPTKSTSNGRGKIISARRPSR